MTDHVSGGTCPPIEQLERLVAEGSSDPGVAAHVQGCETCRNLIDEIQSDNALLMRVAVQDGAVRSDAPTVTVDARGAPSTTGSFPGYRVVEEIARGGQGVVYLAVQVGTNRQVAIKVPLSGRFASSRQRIRFLREIQIAAALRHPNIVTVFESGRTADGRDFVAMEYVSGLALDKYASERLTPDTKAGRPLLDAKLRLIAKVARAVGHAHAKGIIHRDIKPSNIQVDAEGEPRVLDFGLARALVSEDGEHAPMTLDFQGTPAYASPEQVDGSPDGLDTRSDVYSLGVVAYEMLTGRLPYDVNGPLPEVFERIKRSEPVRPSSRDLRESRLPDDVETILLKALSKDPERRYQTADALAADIEDFLAGRAISARRESMLYLIGKAVGRNKGRVTLVGGVVALLVVAGVGAFVSNLFRERAEHEQSRRIYELQRRISESERADAMTLAFRAAMPTQAAIRKMTIGYGARGIDRLSDQANFGSFSNPAIEASVEQVLAETLANDGMRHMADPLLRQSLSRQLQLLGTNDPQIARVMRELALSLLARGRPSTARTFAEKSYQTYCVLYGENSLEAISSKETLARIALTLGKLDESAALCRSALALIPRNPRNDDLETAQCRDTLSMALLAKNESENAELECTRALSARLAHLPDVDPLIQESLRHLATILGQARPGDRVGHVLCRTLGVVSRDALRRMLLDLADDLGRLRDEQATVREEVEALRDLLDLKVALLGEQHRGLISTLSSLWRAGSEDKPAEKEPLLRKMVSVSEIACGAQSIAYANCLEALADNLRDQQRFAECFQVWRQSADIWFALPPDRRDELQVALQQFWPAYWSSLYGDHESNKERLRYCVEVFDRSPVEETPMAPLVHAMHAWNAMRLELVDGAEREARQALRNADGLPASFDGDKARIRFLLGSILVAVDKPGEGEHLMSSAWYGTGLTRGVCDLWKHDMTRQRLALEMAELCRRRNDPLGQRVWSDEVFDRPMP
mgnify:FL=1